jgi:hypothetical protein
MTDQPKKVKKNEETATLRKRINDVIIERTSLGFSVNYEPWSLLRDILNSGLFSTLDAKDSEIKELEANWKELKSEINSLLKKLEVATKTLRIISEYTAVRQDGLLFPNMNPQKIAKEALGKLKEKDNKNA